MQYTPDDPSQFPDEEIFYKDMETHSPVYVALVGLISLSIGVGFFFFMRALAAYFSGP